jgi:hypothetical protein
MRNKRKIERKERDRLKPEARYSPRRYNNRGTGSIQARKITITIAGDVQEKE